MPDLQTTWFLLVGVLIAGYAVLDGFDLGAGMLHLFVARDDRERRTVLAAVAPVWDGNEVWLLTAGGALFAAFPPVYATVFSGLYLALMLLLTGLILRAVSLEFRSKEESAAWRAWWDRGFAAGSFLPALLLGVAIGNILRGVPLDPRGEFAGTFLGLLNPFALLVGVTAVAMFAFQGAAWLVLKTTGAVRERAEVAAFRAWTALVVLWAAGALASRVAAPHLWGAYSELWAWAVPTILAVALLLFPLALQRDHPLLGFTLSSTVVLCLVGLVGQGLYPALVPALGDLPNSLTIRNAASSPYTLGVMLAIALLGMPLVLAYTAFIYSRFRGPVRLEDTAY